MKGIYLAMLAAGLVFTAACTKNNSVAEKKITGSWELRKATGGLIALLEYPPGNKNIQQFEANHHFRVQQHDSVLYEGSFSIEPANNKGDWRLWRSYQFNGRAQTTMDSVRFLGNQLIFLPPYSCCDIQTVFYEQIQ